MIILFKEPKLWSFLGSSSSFRDKFKNFEKNKADFHEKTEFSVIKTS